MLILTRKVGESIRIGDEVVVTVIRVKKDHVQLGIDAPDNVEVWRDELYEQARGERKPPDGNR